ncbi:hypothetical protein ACQRIT_006565 [Beauveria bassiana]
MGKSKPAAKSIRGHISSPIPVADSYSHISEPTQMHFAQQAAQHDSNIRPRQVQGFDQNHIINAADNSTPSSQVPSGAPKVMTIDETAARNLTPEAGRRLSKTQKKDTAVRKRSPIRDVIGRLFGRRKKTPSQLTRTPEPAQRSSAPPQTTAKNEKDGPSRGSGASRSVSLPITEFDRALRSHSIGLDDVIAIRSARNSLVVADQNQPKKRSGGSGSGGSGNNSPYNFGARYIGDGKLAGLCPRPASVNDRDLRSSSAILADDDPDEIGRAITGDAGRLKRRSRSMSAIPRFEVKPEEQQQHRRPRPRSQEVRELRDSCVYGQDPLSPLSSEFPEDDALAAFDLDLPNPPRPAAPEPPPTTTTAAAAASGPFMFGSLISEEEAANRQQVDEVTLSSRVNGIENRLHVVEDSVSLLRYKANPHAHVGWTPGDAALPSGLVVGIQPSYSYPSTRHPHHSLSMGIAPTSTRPSSGHSEAVFTESTSYSDGGNHSSSHSASQQQQQHLSLPDDAAVAAAAARPNSEQTLRGHHRHSQNQNQNLAPQRHASSLLSDEQYSSLLGLLETERSARIALEAQVQQLTRQLNMLLLARHARRGGDHHKASAAPAPVSVFEYDADESESFVEGGGSKGSSPRRNIWHPQQQHSYSLDDSGIDPGITRHASTNHDYNDDDDDDYDDDDDGVESSSQLYATPSEETHAGTFNVYPAAEQEGVASPRTMSLSSITMSPMPTAVM